MKKILLLSTAIFMFNFVFGQILEQKKVTTNSSKGILNETFGMEATEFPADGWTLDASMSGKNWKLDSAYNHTTGESGSAMCNFYSFSAGIESYLITPGLEVTASNKTFGFWYKYSYVALNYGHNDSLFIDISTDDGATWTLGTQNIIQWEESDSTAGVNEGWKEVSIDLGNYEGQNYEGNIAQVRFRGVSSYGSYKLYIDDVTGPKIFGTFENDLAITTITPNGFILTGSEINPKVTVKNLGDNVGSDFEVNLKSEPAGYDETITNPGDINAAESLVMDFPAWSPADGNYTLTATVTMSGDENENNNTKDIMLEVRGYQFGEVVVSFQGVDDDEYGIATDGTNLYTTNWYDNFFYKYDMNGAPLDTFLVEDFTSPRGLAYDGEFFYASSTTSNNLKKLDLVNKVLVEVDEDVPTPVRAIAYCEDDQTFFANELFTNKFVTRFKYDLNTSNSISSVELPMQIRGLAYDKWSEPGNPILWAYENNGDSIPGFYLDGTYSGKSIYTRNFIPEGSGRGLDCHVINDSIFLYAVTETLPVATISKFFLGVVSGDTHTVTFNTKNSSDEIVSGATISINNQELTTDDNGIATIYLPDGTYDYTATKDNCEAVTGNITVSGADISEEVIFTCFSSINDSDAFNVSIYPNPASNLITIESVGKYTLKINDITGKTIYTDTMVDLINIDITNYNSGIYFISLTNNSKTETYKVIKK